MEKSARIGFVTAVQLGLDCMTEISACGRELEIIVTLTDDVAQRKSGRVLLDDYASKYNTILHKTSHINNEDTIEVIEKLSLDYLFVIGWSQLLCNSYFSIVKKAIIGMHPTLLPIGRGRAPIPWTIINGLNKSGVTAFEIKSDADTGDIYGAYEFDVSPTENATTLYDKARGAHVILMREILQKIERGQLVGREQNESQATYWPARRPEDGEIKQNMNMEQIDKLVRGSTRPYPGAFIRTSSGKVTIWSGKIIKNAGKNQIRFNQLVRDNLYFMPTDFEFEG